MSRLHSSTALALVWLALCTTAAFADTPTGASTPAAGDAAAAAPPAATDANTNTERASDALMSEVVITATKKSTGEQAQKVPISMTALGAQQLDALQFRSLESLTYSIPNVQLDQLGTLKGVANFSIRGLGVNSSTPSVEPAVGTFIDGVYLGVNFGVVVDTFDVESIEVLRGPQGVLFGRNVTGGAVAIRTARPDGEFRIHTRIDEESGLIGTGLNQTYAGSVEGSLVKDTLFAKITGYYNHDGGYFYNTTLKRDDGKNDTWFVRPTIVFKPVDNVDFTLIGDHFKLTGDGPVGRNPPYASAFQTSQNEAGLSYLQENSVTLESNWDVGPGDGKITDIANYRNVKQRNLFDLDGQQADTSVTYNYLKQSQKSNELRYAARLFSRVDFVTGLFLFGQDELYIERDVNKPLATPILEGGGHLHQTSFGVFANADISLTNELILGVGGRYSHDHKQFGVDFRAAPPQPCTIATEECASYPSYNGAKNFNSFTPKVTVKYQFDPHAQVYALYTKGYRSGGYNLKAQSVGAALPFDDEISNDFEVGFKGDMFDRKLRLNLGAFYNSIKDLQKQGTFNLPTGPLSLVGNGANAHIKGIEGDVTLKAAKGLVFTGSLGITDGHYTSVTADLNGDHAIDAKDLALKIPRLAPVTYGTGVYYDTDVGNAGVFGAQATFNYRRHSWFNEPNTGRLPNFSDLGANISFAPSALRNAKFTLYGKNLLNDQNTGNNSPLPAFQGGGAITFPTKGRLFGIEADITFR